MPEMNEEGDAIRHKIGDRYNRFGTLLATFTPSRKLVQRAK